MNITAGKFKGQKIIAPDENITRPTLSKVRMSVFNTLQAMIEFEGKSFLDMYAGSGIMGLEALSRGFSSIVMLEKNKKVYNVIKSNLKKYEQDNDIKLFLGDSLKICEKFNGGGHRCAAGCTISGNLLEIKKQIILAVSQCIEVKK